TDSGRQSNPALTVAVYVIRRTEPPGTDVSRATWGWQTAQKQPRQPPAYTRGQPLGDRPIARAENSGVK
ncbi:hypothetical protein BaRGS_00011098, partial [Batillaria attramentaria]